MLPVNAIVVSCLLVRHANSGGCINRTPPPPITSVLNSFRLNVRACLKVTSRFGNSGESPIWGGRSFIDPGGNWGRLSAYRNNSKHIQLHPFHSPRPIFPTNTSFPCESDSFLRVWWTSFEQDRKVLSVPWGLVLQFSIVCPGLISAECPSVLESGALMSGLSYPAITIPLDWSHFSGLCFSHQMLLCCFPWSVIQLDSVSLGWCCIITVYYFIIIFFFPLNLWSGLGFHVTKFPWRAETLP